MDEPITRAEHEEFRKRIDEENNRQNQRINLLEENVRQIGNLTTSVEKLATNMANMVKVQEEQGTRLKSLEGRDGEKWRKVVEYAASVIVGAIIGFIMAHIGF